MRHSLSARYPDIESLAERTRSLSQKYGRGQLSDGSSCGVENQRSIDEKNID